MFLATLIVAAKYLNDSSPKNKFWAAYANIFDLAEINLMEKQLLYLLDYDLRFSEQDALVHFAIFLPNKPSSPCVPSAKEARAAAVSRAKARVQAQMPPTPPHDAVIPGLSPAPAAAATASAGLSGVQNLMKRISSTYLSVASGSGNSRPRPLSRASSSSTLGASSASGDSEAGSLTSDSGSSSPSGSDTSPECDLNIKDPRCIDITDRKFTLQPVPAHAFRQGRKVSTASTCTVKSDATISAPNSDGKSSNTDSKECQTSSPQATRHTASTRLGVGRGAGRRSISQGPGSAHSDSDSGASSSSRHSTVSASTAGFLSRMFGAATKHQDKDKDHRDASNDVSADAPETLATGGALKRLTNSKSTMFRGAQTTVEA